MRNLHSEASFPESSLEVAVWLLGEGGDRAQTPPGVFPSLEISLLHPSGLCRDLAQGGVAMCRYFSSSDGYGGFSSGVCERKVAAPSHWAPVRAGFLRLSMESCDR